MKIIISDIKLDVKDSLVFNKKYKNCVSCFNCWLKDNKCSIKDEISNLSNLILDNELIIVTKCVYGSYSSTVKTIFERCINIVEPFFELRNNEMHHKLKKKINCKVIVYDYDENIEIFKKLIERNSLNLGINMDLFLARKKDINELVCKL